MTDATLEDGAATVRKALRVDKLLRRHLAYIAAPNMPPPASPGEALRRESEVRILLGPGANDPSYLWGSGCRPAVWRDDR
jgi:hypothetical protein